MSRRGAGLPRPPVAQEVEEELAHHLELLARDNVRRGMDAAAARAAARRRFGDLEAVRRECVRIARGRERDVRRRESFAELRQDLHYALRQVAREPGFAAAAVLTLALGIGATAAIFGAVHAVILRPFAYAEPERVVFVATTWRGDAGNVSAGNYIYIKERAAGVRPLAAAAYDSFNLAHGEDPQRVLGARVTADFFTVFGAPPRLGRVFGADEDRPGHERVTVLSERLWKRLGSDPGLVGKTLRLGGVAHVVVGVMPASFDPSS